MTQLIKAPATKPDDLNLKKKKKFKETKIWAADLPIAF